MTRDRLLADLHARFAKRNGNGIILGQLEAQHAAYVLFAFLAQNSGAVEIRVGSEKTFLASRWLFHCLDEIQ